MMADGGRVKTRINAAEKHAQISSDDVANSFACGVDKLFLSWLPGFSQETSVDLEARQL